VVPGIVQSGEGWLLSPLRQRPYDRKRSDDPLFVPVRAKALAALVLVHLKAALFTKVSHYGSGVIVGFCGKNGKKIAAM